MAEYNAGERKDIRAAEKAAKLAEIQRFDVVRSLMSLPAGRSYVLSKLTASHIFHTSFSTDPLQMAFSEGERNQGLQLLNDIMSTCPDMYVQMMKESNERDAAASTRRTPVANGGDSGSESAGEAWTSIRDEDGRDENGNYGDYRDKDQS